MENFIKPIESRALLQRSAVEIEQIRTAIGLPAGSFDLYCKPLLACYADHVQDMPLAPQVYYDAGGAWNMGLKTCFVAAQFAATHIFFPDNAAEERRVLEPQCKYAAFVAALATGVAMLTQNATVGDAKKNSDYHPLTSGKNLYGWLLDHPGARFEWRTPPAEFSEAERAAIGASFIPKGIFEHFDQRIPLMIYGAINPRLAKNGIETTLAKVVRFSVVKVQELFITTDQRRYRGADQPVLQVDDGFSNYAGESTPAAPTNGAVNPPKPDRASPSASTAPETDVSLEYLMSKAHPVLKEWFEALLTHEQYKKLLDQMVLAEDAIEIPVVILGMFGLNGPQVRKHMEAAGMIIGRTTNAKGIKLHLALKPLLFKDTA